MGEVSTGPTTRPWRHRQKVPGSVAGDLRRVGGEVFAQVRKEKLPRRIIVFLPKYAPCLRLHRDHMGFTDLRDGSVTPRLTSAVRA